MKNKILIGVVVVIIIVGGIIFGVIQNKNSTENNSNIIGSNSENKNNNESKNSLASQVKIGDYVNYNAGKENSYTSTKEKNGQYNQTFETTGTEKWRVIDISDDGTVTLISESGINSKTNNMFELNGGTGYANAEDELNNICAIYGKGNNAVSARSMTNSDILKIVGIENIANKLNIDLSDYSTEEEKIKILLENFVKRKDVGTNQYYGQTFNITNSDNKYVPDNQNEKGYTKNSNLTIVDSYVPQVKMNDYINDTKVLDLAFGTEKHNDFWLSGTSIQFQSTGTINQTDKFYATYRVHFASSDGTNYNLTSNKLFNSNNTNAGNNSSNVKSVRPVVILDKNTTSIGGTGTKQDPFKI